MGKESKEEAVGNNVFIHSTSVISKNNKTYRNSIRELLPNVGTLCLPLVKGVVSLEGPFYCALHYPIIFVIGFKSFKQVNSTLGDNRNRCTMRCETVATLIIHRIF